ncbi:MAG: hypothetical protein J1E62_10635 [Lachnospiraceae bacterium]|nr:hypothetical protein [Lachnospiraceae bacterium]
MPYFFIYMGTIFDLEHKITVKYKKEGNELWQYVIPATVAVAIGLSAT